MKKIRRILASIVWSVADALFGLFIKLTPEEDWKKLQDLQNDKMEHERKHG